MKLPSECTVPQWVQHPVPPSVLALEMPCPGAMPVDAAPEGLASSVASSSVSANTMTRLTHGALPKKLSTRHAARLQSAMRLAILHTPCRDRRTQCIAPSCSRLQPTAAVMEAKL